MGFIQIVEETERIPIEISDSTIYCRRYSTAAHTKIEKPLRKSRTDRQGQRYFEVDEFALNAAILDFVIVDWEGVKDGQGNDVECTTENKLKLPGDVITRLLEESGAASIIGGSGDQPPDPHSGT